MTDQNGFGTGAPANLSWQNDNGAYTFGQRFRVTANGLSATKIRFYVPAGSPNGAGSGYQVGLYDVGNPTPLETAGPATFSVGWNEVTIPSHALTNGGNYLAAVLVPAGYFGADTVLFGSGDYDPPNDLILLSAGAFNVGGTLTYPTSTFGTPWYGVDVTVFDGAGTETATLDVTLPALTAALAGQTEPAATLGVSLPSLTAALAGQTEPAATLGVSLPSLLASFTATPPGSATLDVVLPKIRASLAGYSSSTALSTAASAVLARWFTSTVSVERFAGQTGLAATYDPPDSVLAMVDHGNTMVRAPNGDQVVSSARVFLPVDTTPIPLGSRITLPAAYGGARAIVLTVNVRKAPGMPVPEHLEVALT